MEKKDIINPQEMCRKNQEDENLENLIYDENYNTNEEEKK